MKSIKVEVITYNNCYGQGYHDFDSVYKDGTSMEGVILAGTFPAWLAEHNAERAADGNEPEGEEEFDLEEYTIVL